MIKRIDHQVAQRVGVCDFAEGEGKLFGAGDVRVVCNAADGENEDVVVQRIAVLEPNGLRVEIDVGGPGDHHVDLVVEQFVVAGADVPGFDFAAEVLVKHGGEDEVVIVGDEGHVDGASEFEGGEQSSESTTQNHDLFLRHACMVNLASVRYKTPF